MALASIRADFAMPARRRASARSTSRRTGHTALATALLAGNLLAVAAVLASAHPDAHLLADPELARLLRGMALIKVAIVSPMLALLAWRLHSPLAPRMAIGYALAACAMSTATALIWQLSAIAPAALLFHGGALTLILLAWRDDMPRSRLAPFIRQREAAPRA
jgi:hypothetical protein